MAPNPLSLKLSALFSSLTVMKSTASWTNFASNVLQLRPRGGIMTAIACMRQPRLGSMRRWPVAGARLSANGRCACVRLPWPLNGSNRGPPNLCTCVSLMGLRPSLQANKARPFAGNGCVTGLKLARRGSKPRSTLLRSLVETCKAAPPRSLILPLGRSRTLKVRFVNLPRVWMGFPSPSSVRCTTSTCIDWPSFCCL